MFKNIAEKIVDLYDNHRTAYNIIINVYSAAMVVGGAAFAHYMTKKNP